MTPLGNLNNAFESQRLSERILFKDKEVDATTKVKNKTKRH